MIRITEDFISLPSRDNITNNGAEGHVLIIGGDVGMCGAAAFAAEAAYRSGCGLVRIYTHPDNRIPVQSLVPEAVLSFWEHGIDTPILDSCLEWADAVVIGVGFGMGDIQKKLLRKVISSCSVPFVIDADALNILSLHKSLLTHLSSNVVLTPHLGELSRLTGLEISEIKQNTLTVLRDKFDGINIAAKSSQTYVRLSDGVEYVSESGDSSLSTGGAGDILSGMIASFIAQRMPIEKALPYAVYLHGKAGAFAGSKYGVRSVIARDVISSISEVLKEY